MDGIVVDMLKIEGISIINWLVRIFNTCIEFGVVPEGNVYRSYIQRERSQKRMFKL